VTGFLGEFAEVSTGPLKYIAKKEASSKAQTGALW
jgi:hypothetical protein